MVFSVSFAFVLTKVGKNNNTILNKTMLYNIVLYLLIITKLAHVAGQGGSELRVFTDKLTSELYYLNPNDCTSVWGVSMLFDLFAQERTIQMHLNRYVM